MPLYILGPLVVLGIGGIVLLLHMLGLTAPLRFSSDAQVKKAWLREYSEDAPSQILRAASGRAALLKLQSGALGLVTTMGADPLAHDLTGTRWTETATGLRLDLLDYGAPRFNIQLTEIERQSWLQLKDSA